MAPRKKNAANREEAHLSAHREREPDWWRERFEEHLARRHQRLTRQREAVADALFHHDGHFNIDELFVKVCKKEPSVGHATIYRTVKLLEECGLVTAAQFGDGTTRYEAAGDAHAHHDHLICTSCGMIVEFENAEIEALQEKVVREHHFRMHRHKMEIYGLCESCVAREAQAALRPPFASRVAKRARGSIQGGARLAATKRAVRSTGR